MQSLRTLRSLRSLRTIGLRRISTTTPRAAAFNLRERPGPPRLPKEEQEEYERLQRESTGAFQTSHTVTEQEIEVSESDVHKDLRKGAKPEFEGEVNPKTGEVGGPKNDPLRYSEWTYNGRATDF
ncbi:hypothetical protein FPQ18DRAFT_321949 [Pyronema domesticum]|uniref:Succinate dehydrogenase assembly factor 4, mitochondrial n=1 Tax=Pyronema omphalodes (strain CBS 100304) TaxID=1076935 RepID=U4LL85_PYROM|nr:hypothetical protein FPQ18DRAFT_321949 [Pyronema domesticum]CCX32869.1 Similar to Protein FMP21, mitochondrial; acc. no. P38345 [Pyronema omphalodes CBS 100304]